MKNDIYDLLNDIDNQIDTFETVDITSTDLKNWKQSFALKKKTSVKKHTWKIPEKSRNAAQRTTGITESCCSENVISCRTKEEFV
jgi:hypothetical protein